MTLAGALHGAGIQLELLTGPMTCIYDPAGIGSMLFAVCAVAAQLDRDYIRDKTLEGQQAAAARGNHGGRPKVVDHDTFLYVRALRETGTPMPQIACTVTINTGKNAGSHPSVAFLYRALDEVLLTAWMHDHLRVIPLPVADADTLGRIETAVLSSLDPPLNLSKMAASPIRSAVSQLRRRQTK